MGQGGISLSVNVCWGCGRGEPGPAAQRRSLQRGLLDEGTPGLSFEDLVCSVEEKRKSGKEGAKGKPRGMNKG